MRQDGPELKYLESIEKRITKLEAAWEAVVTFVALYGLLIVVFTWAPNVLLNHPFPIPPEILWYLPYAFAAIVYVVKRLGGWIGMR